MIIFSITHLLVFFDYHQIKISMSSIIIISSMLKYIEINNSLLHKFREGQETVLRNIHN